MACSATTPHGSHCCRYLPEHRYGHSQHSSSNMDSLVKDFGCAAVSYSWRLLGALRPLVHALALLMTVTLSWTSMETVHNSGAKPESLRLTLYSVDAVSSILSTVSLRLACCFGRPLLQLPWLVFTLQGLFLRQGPCLLTLAQSMLRVDWGFGVAFLLICVTVYCEQIALWLQVARSFLSKRPEWAIFKLHRKRRNHAS